MAKLCSKKPSKRLTCRKKFKVQRKVREHSRKLKKQSKVSQRKTKTEKQISVPGKCPFKEEILLEAKQMREEAKALKAERKARQKTQKCGVGKKQPKLEEAAFIDALAECVVADDAETEQSLGDGGTMQLNSAIRKAVKRRKKNQKKMSKRTDKLAGQLEDQMEF